MSVNVVILDFGSQYTHLISRRLRDLGVNVKIMPNDSTFHAIQELHPSALILSGGPSSTYEGNSPDLRFDVSTLDIPVLGICYGHQLLVQKLGGEVKPGVTGEYGITVIQVDSNSVLFKGLEDEQVVWMSHGDQVMQLPEGFRGVAKSQQGEYAAYENTVKRVFGVQFHPEVAHTLHGTTVLKNFLEFAGVPLNQSLTPLIDRVLPKKVQGNIILGLSGGVDSTVTAALLHRAMPEQLHCIFVDTGLMRSYDLKDLQSVTKALGLKHVHVIDASKEFLSALVGISDPEEKRKIIGRLFIEVFEREAKRLATRYGDFKWLAQGTIYPDRIESAGSSKVAKKIKSHHNVGGLPEKLGLQLIEPLKDLYKDEVRKLGLELGIDPKFVFRHPFPGPGLAVRILGDITKEKVEMTRRADEILYEELQKHGLYDRVWQAYAAFLPIKTVGVMGDNRTYEYAIAIRLIESVDAMTADVFALPKDVAVKISARIVNEIKGINRVFYDITQKPPATIELE